MRTRFTHVFLAVWLLIPLTAFSQTHAPKNPSPQSFPTIQCQLQLSDTKLFFVGNDYVPNTITATVTVKNISPDTAIARYLTANMVADTRFIIAGSPIVALADSLMPDSTVSVSFTLYVASPRAVDGYDIERALVTSDNANGTSCVDSVWVEHEYYPDISPLCSKTFTQIIFDDNINDYTPNPFTLNVDLTNTHDGASDSTMVQYLGTRGVSLFPQDSSIKFLGTVAASGGKASTTFQLIPNRRANDTTVTICFQVRGVGGYKRKIYLDTCCINIFIPQSKQNLSSINQSKTNSRIFINKIKLR
jgi:hypothetical protein